LTNADKTDLNGAEHYVWTCLEEGDITWFPRLTSSTLQNADVDDSDDLLRDMSARMARLETSLAELSAKLN
jgi:hypothetical protein